MMKDKTYSLRSRRLAATEVPAVVAPSSKSYLEAEAAPERALPTYAPEPTLSCFSKFGSAAWPSAIVAELVAAAF